MALSKILKIGSACVGLGVAAGFALAQYLPGIHESSFRGPGVPRIDQKPCVPIFGTVSAASFTDQDLPAPAEPGFSPRTNDQIMRYGFPSHQNVLSKRDYVLSYDTRNRNANWVFEHLTAESVASSEKFVRPRFFEDKDVHPFFRVKNSDYKGSGFDRGHLAAAGNHKKSKEDYKDTFAFSNIAPQVGIGFNRHKWNDLEQYVRDQCMKYKNVYVCTGPLYLPGEESDGKLYVKYEVIGVRHVAVPTHFFKVCVYETEDGHYGLESFVMPNKAIDESKEIEKFLRPPEAIERASGLLFLDELDRKKIREINRVKTTFTDAPVQ